MMDAAVVGAGIGGLTAAVALSRQGWTVRVLERAPALEAVGAGLGVAPNAVRVLDLVGAGERVRELAAVQGSGGIRRHDGRWLARTDVASMADLLGAPFIAARRSDLVAILSDLLPAGALQVDSEVLDAAPGSANTRATVRTATGSVDADLVVCADGISSFGRRSLFPGAPSPTYSGCTTWRMVVPATGPVSPGESWGPGAVFGILPLTRGEYYCYAMTYAEPGGHAGDERALLQRTFAGWHDPIPALLDAVSGDAVLRNDVYDLPTPLPPFHSGRVALLGDAAHAMTPNLGQGACQAMEDAAVLAYHVGNGGGDVPTALAAYTEDRRPRTTSIVRQARRMMRMAQLSSPAAVLARNAGMAVARRLSVNATLRLFFGLATWKPPQDRGR